MYDSVHKVLSSVLAATQAAMKTLLIADDNERIRYLIKSFFYEFRVLGVTDGAEVVDKIGEVQPDLVVLDFMMPKMNGLEAARKLRQMKIAVPIILFTMHPDSVPKSEISPEGINAVVMKPNLMELQKHVESLLGPVN